MCGIGNGSSRCSRLLYLSLTQFLPHFTLSLSHTTSSKSIISHAWVFLSEDVANRVCLGLIPTSEGSWVTAVRALRWIDKRIKGDVYCKFGNGDVDYGIGNGDVEWQLLM
nr:hypothetical protein CFP56_31108 [Quercus suber]